MAAKAKRRHKPTEPAKVDLPSVDVKVVLVDDKQPDDLDDTKELKPDPFLEVMELTLPMPDRLIPTVSRTRTDARFDSQKQQRGGAIITSTLIESGATLENGTPVTRQMHAVKWLFEHFANAFAEK